MLLGLAGGEKRGSRSRRHHEPLPASSGLLWGPGNGLSLCFGNKFFLMCFLQLSGKRGLLQTPPGTFGLPEPETALALPGDQPLAVTRELLPAPVEASRASLS